VSKNFAKTSALVLNEITSHKLAGIFAKPLSERDAPGYKTLVKRPQDLKTIRTAVQKGSKAAVVAIEALESEGAVQGKTEGELAWGGVRDKEGPLGETGMFLVKITDDLVPPKGIVNSAQLEREVTRMFANAVMFNPLAGEERGFGRSLRLRKDGGDPEKLKAKKMKVKKEEKGEDEEVEESAKEKESDDDDEGDEDKSDATASETESGTESSSSSEGGSIIADTREIFTDVMDMIRRWRDVEVERIVSAAPTSAGGVVEGRHGSLASAVEEEVETPSAAVEEGMGRAGKRRRVGE
jgi:hypothetical protein